MYSRRWRRKKNILSSPFSREFVREYYKEKLWRKKKKEERSVPIDGAILMHIETKQIVQMGFVLFISISFYLALENPVGLVDRWRQWWWWHGDDDGRALFPPPIILLNFPFFSIFLLLFFSSSIVFYRDGKPFRDWTLASMNHWNIINTTMARARITHLISMWMDSLYLSLSLFLFLSLFFPLAF